MSTTVTQAANPSGNVVTTTTDPVTGGNSFFVNGKSAGIVTKEAISVGALLTDWSNGTLATTGSTGTGFAFALDSTVTLFGKPTAKCTFPSDASAQTFIGKITLTNPIRLRDVQVVHVPIQYTSSNGAGGVGNPFQLWLQTSTSKSIRLQMLWASGTSNPALGSAGVWHTYSFQRGSSQIIGTGTFADFDTANEAITAVHIVQATTGAAANTNPVWVGEIRADAKRIRGRVSIVMDGEYSSQYSLIHPLLSAAGLRASFAITTTDIGLSGRMTAAQLDEMNTYGHEMIHHTYNATKSAGYVNATDWPTSLVITEDIRAQWAYFRSRGWLRGIGFGVWGYAYTFEGGQTQARQNLVRDALRSGGLTAVRKSTPYGGESKHLVPTSRMPIDPLVISGAIQITGSNTAADVQAAIDNAELTGQWAIITVHRAVNSAPGSLEMTTENMATWIAYLKARQDAGGVVVEPFGEAYSELFGDKY